MKQTFEKELTELINSHCVENESDTPDFILAEYILGCLENYTRTVRRRDDWYGDERWPDTSIPEHTPNLYKKD